MVPVIPNIAHFRELGKPVWAYSVLNRMLWTPCGRDPAGQERAPRSMRSVDVTRRGENCDAAAFK
jgi:hypothetical protein